MTDAPIPSEQPLDFDRILQSIVISIAEESGIDRDALYEALDDCDGAEELDASLAKDAVVVSVGRLVTTAVRYSKAKERRAEAERVGTLEHGVQQLARLEKLVSFLRRSAEKELRRAGRAAP